MSSWLLDLPESIICLILRNLPSPQALCAALSSHPALAALAEADPGIWEPLAAEFAWRLRQRQAETPLEMCVRTQRCARTQSILVLGGSKSDEEPVGSVDAYAVGGEQWSDAKMMLPRRSPHAASWRVGRDAPAAASDGSRMMLVGGWDPEEDAPLATADVACFDGAALSWSPLPALPRPQCFGAAALDGAQDLWVAGGGDTIFQGATCSDELLYLPSGGASWRVAGNLQTRRCGLALAADPRSSCLYAVGGYAGGLRYEASVEAFDMFSLSQTTLPHMRSPRSGAAASFGPDGALYVVGGSEDGSRPLATAERFDPREGTWSLLPPLAAPRGYLAGTFALDGRLYVAGGSGSDGSPTDAFEAFEPRMGKWTSLQRTPCVRSNLAVVLMGAT